MKDTQKKLILDQFAEGEATWGQYWSVVGFPKDYDLPTFHAAILKDGLEFHVSITEDDHDHSLFEHYGEYVDNPDVPAGEEYRIFERKSGWKFFVANNVINRKQAEENYRRVENLDETWSYLIMGVEYRISIPEDQSLSLGTVWLSGLESDAGEAEWRRWIEEQVDDAKSYALPRMAKIYEVLKNTRIFMKGVKDG